MSKITHSQRHAALRLQANLQSLGAGSSSGTGAMNAASAPPSAAFLAQMSHRIEACNNELEGSVRRLENLRDRIFGSAPDSGTTNALPAGPGYLGELDVNVQSYSMLVDRMIAATDSLERLG